MLSSPTCIRMSTIGYRINGIYTSISRSEAISFRRSFGSTATAVNFSGLSAPSLCWWPSAPASTRTVQTPHIQNGIYQDIYAVSFRRRYGSNEFLLGAPSCGDGPLLVELS